MSLENIVENHTHSLLEEYVEATTRKPFVVKLPLFTTNEKIMEMDAWYEGNKVDKESRKHPTIPETAHFFESEEHATMFKLSFGGDYVDFLQKR